MICIYDSWSIFSTNLMFSLMVGRWYTDDVLMVYRWCTDNMLMMHYWLADDALMRYMYMMHIPMMHMYMILNPWHWTLIHVYMMHVCMHHVSIWWYASMILDPWLGCIYARIHDAYLFDFWSWCMRVWCIYLWSLTLMYIVMMLMRMMHISVILDPDYDGYIYDSWPLTWMHIWMYLRCI